MRADCGPFWDNFSEWIEGWYFGLEEWGDRVEELTAQAFASCCGVNLAVRLILGVRGTEVTGLWR